MGGLSRPAVPAIPGLDDFAGPKFHSAAWDHAAPLDGRRVGVVGTGASAIQFVPAVAARAGRLTVFQRSAPWILPKADRPFTPLERRALCAVPGAARAYRAWIYSTQELRALAFTEGSWMMRLGQAMARRHLHAQVHDPALRAKLTPDYAMGCKRVLLSNDYYPALTRPHVEGETTRIARVHADGVETVDGRRHPLDVLILGTGFAVHDYVGRADVRGLGGASLAETWRRGAEAYLGTTVAGFPNLFVLVGPNTGLAHTSMVFMIESQLAYVLGALDHLRQSGAAALALRPEVQTTYNAELTARLDGRVWSSGCSTWYRDANGKNSTLWPGFTFEFRARTARFDAASYMTLGARSPGAGEVQDEVGERPRRLEVG
jgi:cation diffusion facilitator CzcD-associated flavoprotein CzcO